ncbi:DUF6262 family protein [Arthrobacter sp. A2-55]|uniref:DUF6262 family protein n=1 Tax=Arthrobacter sp. A2-55 TaxID=2897337 RepID=UPI0021CD3C3A|nr:DUF6262 family protein [Arthrobacter sp. A2-55]MCU6479033.1 DUF6262 family protein [Arthrobacter sp. A2-55]
MSGNPGNLRQAARAKHEAALLRAEKGLKAVLRAQTPITFEGVAAAAGVSKDFLYRTPDLRARITMLREQQTPAAIAAAGRNAGLEGIDTSSIIRTLTAKLASERAQHRQELAELNQALAAAHGQILSLRRHLPNA